MKPIYKLIYTLIASLTLLLAGCGGSSNTVSEADKAKMQRAETQTAALKTAYDAAVAALETLEDDTSDATQAEVDDAQAKLDALKAAITAAVDVADEVKAMYPAAALETRLTAARGSAAPALAAEQARMARAETQTTALKTAYDAAIAALETLEDDTSDATQAEVDDAQAKLDALKAAITAAMDVSEEVKAMYPADALETRLTTARGSAAPALADEQARMARAETQTTALKMAYDEARAALAKLKDNTDDATQEEVDDARAKLRVLKEKIAEAVDVSDEVKEMYPAETIETELTETEKLAGFGLTLERLRTAASKAIEDARKEMDDARTAIEGAETAIEDLGIIRIQTGSGNHMVAQDVEKARMAYDTAKAAYDAARKKYEMEREEADTIAKMNALSVAAEQARKDAEAAKMAAETARTDAETDVETLNRTALRYDSGMYKVGDQSITSGAPKKVITTTMADGKTTRTQTMGVRDIALRGLPITATLKTAVQDIVVGTYTDSNDDTARLRVINKYPKTKKSNVYHLQRVSAAITLFVEEKLATSTHPPYGAQNTRDDSYPIVKEDGEFYQVTGLEDTNASALFTEHDSLDSTNIGEVTVVNGKNDNEILERGIYSFTPTKAFRFGKVNVGANEKVYLKRFLTGSFRTGDPPPPGTFHSPDGYHYISILEDVTFPVAVAYEHMNYGMWASLKEDGETPADLGIGFVRNLAENSMTGTMPTTGTATYQGHWVANVRKAHDAGSGMIEEASGRSKTTANFATNAITVDLIRKGNDSEDKFATLTGGTISGNTFKGTGVTVHDATETGVKTTAGGGKYTGGFNGALFGPEAVEVGGVFDFTSEGKKHGELRGAFGGRKM